MTSREEMVSSSGRVVVSAGVVSADGVVSAGVVSAGVVSTSLVSIRGVLSITCDDSGEVVKLESGVFMGQAQDIKIIENKQHTMILKEFLIDITFVIMNILIIN